VNVNIFRQAIAAEVLDGGTFNEGRKFLKESLNPGSVVTSEIAARELTKAGIDIGQWRYTNSPVRLIKRAIADNPRLVEIVKEEKKSAVKLMKIKQSRLPGGGSWAYMWVKNPERMGWLTRYARDLRSYTLGYDTDYTWSNILGKHYIRMVSEDPGVPAIVIGTEEELHMVEGSHLAKLIIPNNIWEMSRNEFESLLSSFLPRTLRVIKDHLGLKYAWQSGLFFEYVGERLPDKHDIIPVVGLSADIQAKMKVTGISSAGDDNAIVITNLAASLIRDRQLPNDITAEKLITLLTNPAIMSDPKNITNALVAMGASGDSATRFASDFFSATTKYLMLNSINSFSTRDQIIGHMDLRQKVYEKLVEFGPLDHAKLSDYLSGMAVLHGLLDKELGMRKTRVYVEGEGIHTLRKEMLGSLFDEQYALIHVYPANPI
jgi:hypothetical protein